MLALYPVMEFVRLIEKVEDYNELDTLRKIPGREVAVLYARLIYRVIDGQWKMVGRLTSENTAVYRPGFMPPGNPERKG